mgnify:CR=1 FL=1
MYRAIRFIKRQMVYVIPTLMLLAALALRARAGRVVGGGGVLPRARAHDLDLHEAVYLQIIKAQTLGASSWQIMIR